MLRGTGYADGMKSTLYFHDGAMGPTSIDSRPSTPVPHPVAATEDRPRMSDARADSCWFPYREDMVKRHALTP